QRKPLCPLWKNCLRKQMWHCGFTAIKAQVQKAIKSYLAAAQTFYTDLIHMTKKRLPKHWIKFNRPDGRRTVWRCQKQKKTFRNLVERKIPILYIWSAMGWKRVRKILLKSLKSCMIPTSNQLLMSLDLIWTAKVKIT